MKVLATLLVLPAIAYAAKASLSYDPIYDNRSGSLKTVACSNGTHGLMPRYRTFGQLPSFPYIGGAPAIEGFDSKNCGTCWNVTYTDGRRLKRSINMLAIDVGSKGFNVGKQAMDYLTNNQAERLGRVNVDAYQVWGSSCGMPPTV